MRELGWIGSSLHDLRAFPDEVQRSIGYALYAAQVGGKHPNAKPLRGFLGAGVLEIAAGGEFVSSEFGVGDTPPWPGSDFGLTLRESEVAALLTDGLSNKEIAIALWISENTVKTHLKAIFQKTAVTTRAQAVIQIASGPQFARRRIA